MSERNLTDEDVQAIVNALSVRVKQEFYEDLGRGMWSVAWKVIVGTLITIAAYGSIKGLR